MSSPMPTVTVRLPETLLAAIDGELERASKKNPIAKPSRSDWVRHAIECQLAERQKKAARKKKLPKNCALCGLRLKGPKDRMPLPAVEGVTEFVCASCASTKLLS